MILAVAYWWLHEFRYWFEFETKLLILIVIGVIYFVPLMKFIIRNQEKEADEFVIEMGFSLEIYKSASYKLDKLNNSDVRISSLDEKFQTHPTTENRLKNLEKFNSK